MQPDYTTSNHWPPLSQNCWLYQPTVAAPSYFSMAEFHPDTVRGAGRYSDQMVLNPPGDKPATRTSHLSSYRNSSTNYQTPTSYLPSHGNTFYPARGPIRQDLLSSPADPYRILERGTANSQYSSFNSLLERNTDLATNKDSFLTGSPSLEESSSLALDDKVTRPQRGRTVFSAHQLHELEKVFITDQYISGQQRRRLSALLGLTETQVRVWFQNRRIKWRKNRLERKIKM